MTVVIASNVGASMSAATGRPTQGHIQYALIQGAWWLFYLTGTQNLSALYSVDFATWTAPTGSPYSLFAAHNSEGRDMSFWYQDIASISGAADVLHCDIVEATSTLYHMRFTLGSTWSNTNAELETTVASGGSGIVTVPSSTLDSTKTPWVAMSAMNSTSCGGDVGSNADAGTSWTAGFGSPQIVFNAGPYCSSSAIFSVGSGQVLAITDNAHSNVTMTNLESSLTVLQTFGVASAVFGTALTATDTNAWGACLRTTSDVHAVALNDNSSNYSHARWNGAIWSAGDSIPSLAYGTNSGVYLATDGTFVWAFVLDTSKNLQYSKWTSGSGWSAWTILVSARTNTPAYITGIYGNNNIALVWTESTGTNYNIVGDTLFPVGVAPLSSLMDLNVLARKLYAAHSAYWINRTTPPALQALLAASLLPAQTGRQLPAADSAYWLQRTTPLTPALTPTLFPAALLPAM